MVEGTGRKGGKAGEGGRGKERREEGGWVSGEEKDV